MDTYSYPRSNSLPSPPALPTAVSPIAAKDYYSVKPSEEDAPGSVTSPGLFKISASKDMPALLLLWDRAAVPGRPEGRVHLLKFYLPASPSHIQQQPPNTELAFTLLTAQVNEQIPVLRPHAGIFKRAKDCWKDSCKKKRGKKGRQSWRAKRFRKWSIMRRLTEKAGWLWRTLADRKT